MKKTLINLLVLGILYSCNNDDDTNSNIKLIGNWRLIEVLTDSGGGSGIFSAVKSDKIITFKNGGIITSNGNLCDMTISSDSQTSGTYSETKQTFNSSNCDNPDYNFKFEQNGNFIIVNYPCFEPCKAKYKKE